MEKEKEKAKKSKIPTAIKRNIQNEKRRLRNKSFLSKIKTAISNFKKALNESEVALSMENLKEVFSLVDKGAKKKILHKNNANRIKSRLTKSIKAKS